MHHQILGVVLVTTGLVGCDHLRTDNTADWFGDHARAKEESLADGTAKCVVWFPARDIVTFDWAARAMFGDPAWNVTPEGQVRDSALFTNRDMRRLTAEEIGRIGAGTLPRGPWAVKKVKEADRETGASAGFVGKDATGATYMVKLDDPEYPELGSAAEAIASRALCVLGYNVPDNFVVTIEGTEDARFDGKRALASRFVEGQVLGTFEFDWFRYRREIRCLRLACAWLNDVDRWARNTLVVRRGEQTYYYLIDFNSSLGAWQGRPKEPWRGWRHASDSPLLAGILTAGLWRAPWDDNQRTVSTAVGRFDARIDPPAWRPQLPNTAFDHMTGADARWMTRRLAMLSREQVEAIVAVGRLSRPEDANYLVDILLDRRDRIVRTWPPDSPAPSD